MLSQKIRVGLQNQKWGVFILNLSLLDWAEGLPWPGGPIQGHPAFTNVCSFPVGEEKAAKKMSGGGLEKNNYTIKVWGKINCFGNTSYNFQETSASCTDHPSTQKYTTHYSSMTWNQFP